MKGRRALRSAVRFLRPGREKLMYLAVGGWNTLFTYACFVVLYFLLHERLPAAAILILVWALATVNGYLGFRYMVFAPVRHPVIEYLRYQVVYVPILIANLVILPLALAHTSLSAYLIQALISAAAIVGAYFGNKFFVFRRPNSPD
jgi:putative flippase GtrA